MELKMNYKLGIAALVTLLAAFASSAHVPCVCPRNLRPARVSNECRFNCERSKGKTNHTLENPSPSKEEEVIPVCICVEYNPVCGNDGTTYPNRCVMECKSNVELAHLGRCEVFNVKKYKNTEVPKCICFEEVDPVCGSDGNSYPNPCQLNCATEKNHSLSIKHKGRCTDADKECVCAKEMKPVCGSNGVSYYNPCELICAKANDSTLRIKHNGACGGVIVVNN